jgi:group I intron endonuclease
MKFIYDGHSLKSGIYKITNVLNNRVYIGSAREFKERWKNHQRSLINNKHQNKYLQNDFNKYYLLNGNHDFLVFEILELLEGDKRQRTLKEQYYVDKYYDQQKECYNIKKEVLMSDPFYKHNNETKKKLSDLAKKRTGDKNSNYGNKWTEGMKEMQRKKVAERCSNPDYRNQLSIGQKNKKMSLEEKNAANEKRKISNKKAYHDNSETKQKVLAALEKALAAKRKEVEQHKDGILVNIYPSIKSASIAVQISACSISDCCRGKQKTAAGYVWKYKSI